MLCGFTYPRARDLCNNRYGVTPAASDSRRSSVFSVGLPQGSKKNTSLISSSRPFDTLQHRSESGLLNPLRRGFCRASWPTFTADASTSPGPWTLSCTVRSSTASVIHFHNRVTSASGLFNWPSSVQCPVWLRLLHSVLSIPSLVPRPRLPKLRRGPGIYCVRMRPLFILR